MREDMKDLSPPRSGLFLEVSFRRLLNSCQDIMEGDVKHRDDLKDWRTSPVFHHYVETLQEQLSDLEGSSTRRLEPRVLEAYKEVVDGIASQLQSPNVPAYIIPLPKDKRAVSSVPTATAQQLAKSRAEIAGRGEYVRVQDGGQAAGQGERGERGVRLRGSDNGPPAGQRPPRLQELSADATQSVLRQRNLQENLTEQLVPMAATLRRHAQAMQQAVSERGNLLEDAETVLDGNVAAAGRAVKDSKIVYQRNKRSFWWTLLVLFFTGITFLGVYLFIKASRMAGYKRIPSVRAPAMAHQEL